MGLHAPCCNGAAPPPKPHATAATTRNQHTKGMLSDKPEDLIRDAHQFLQEHGHINFGAVQQQEPPAAAATAAADDGAGNGDQQQQQQPDGGAEGATAAAAPAEPVTAADGGAAAAAGGRAR